MNDYYESYTSSHQSVAAEAYRLMRDKGLSEGEAVFQATEGEAFCDEDFCEMGDWLACFKENPEMYAEEIDG